MIVILDSSLEDLCERANNPRAIVRQTPGDERQIGGKQAELVSLDALQLGIEPVA